MGKMIFQSLLGAELEFVLLPPSDRYSQRAESASSFISLLARFTKPP